MREKCGELTSSYLVITSLVIISSAPARVESWQGGRRSALSDDCTLCTAFCTALYTTLQRALNSALNTDFFTVLKTATCTAYSKEGKLFSVRNRLALTMQYSFSCFSRTDSVPSVQCSVASAQCAVSSAQCSVPSGQCSVHLAHYTVPSAQFSVPSVHFSIPSVQFSVPSAHCSVNTDEVAR